MKKITLLLMLYTFATAAQNFEKSYRAWWGETMWEFHFKSDGRFNRVSFGHYGYTDVKGKYVRKGDTLTILKGYKDTNATIAHKYLIDLDNKLIDTYLLQEYSEVTLPDTITTFFEVQRKLQKVLLSDHRGVVFDTLIYYSADNYDIDKDKKQLYYFLNYSKLLTRAGRINLFNYKIDLIEEPERYDEMNRLVSYVYQKSKSTALPTQQYVFEYIDNSDFKLKSITNNISDTVVEKFIFEYEDSGDLKTVIELDQSDKIRRTYNFIDN